MKLPDYTEILANCVGLSRNIAINPQHQTFELFRKTNENEGIMNLFQKKLLKIKKVES